MTAGPNALRGSAPGQKPAFYRCTGTCGLSRSPDRPALHYVLFALPTFTWHFGAPQPSPLLFTIITHSRSPSEGMDSALPSLEDVVARLRMADGLSARARADCRSALRSIGRIIGRPLSEIPASPRHLRSRMDELSPARFGLTPGRWANIRSLALKALKLTGIAALTSRHVSPLSPEWQRLYDLLPKRPQRVKLSRFVHRHSELGVGPKEVTQEAFERFANELEHRGLRSRPREAYREACRAWNWAVENVPGWPCTLIVVSDRRNRYSQPWETFPPSLKADIDAMVEDAISPDLLSPTSRRPIKPVSARSRLTLLRRFISALVLRGRDPLTLCCIADLVEPDTVREGLRFFLERVGQSTHRRHPPNRKADVHPGQALGGCPGRSPRRPRCHPQTPRSRTPWHDREEPRYIATVRR